MNASTKSSPKTPVATSIAIVAWPLRDQPAVAWLTIALLALVGALARWAAGSWLLACLAMFLAAISTWRVFIPQRFEFSSNGIAQQVWRLKRRIAWSAIERYDPRPDGVFLSPAGAEAPIDALKGLYVPLGPRRDEVIALIEQQLAHRATPPPDSAPARVGPIAQDRPE